MTKKQQINIPYSRVTPILLVLLLFPTMVCMTFYHLFFFLCPLPISPCKDSWEDFSDLVEQMQMLDEFAGAYHSIIVQLLPSQPTNSGVISRPNLQGWLCHGHLLPQHITLSLPFLVLSNVHDSLAFHSVFTSS